MSQRWTTSALMMKGVRGMERAPTCVPTTTLIQGADLSVGVMHSSYLTDMIVVSKASELTTNNMSSGQSTDLRFTVKQTSHIALWGICGCSYGKLPKPVGSSFTTTAHWSVVVKLTMWTLANWIEKITCDQTRDGVIPRHREHAALSVTNWPLTKRGQSHVSQT